MLLAWYHNKRWVEKRKRNIQDHYFHAQPARSCHQLSYSSRQLGSDGRDPGTNQEKRSSRRGSLSYESWLSSEIAYSRNERPNLRWEITQSSWENRKRHQHQHQQYQSSLLRQVWFVGWSSSLHRCCCHLYSKLLEVWPIICCDICNPCLRPSQNDQIR